ncbi:MAG TPA: hypothetical protein ENN53_06240, partial [Candidatus Acetothermia bacterium]|nr:hypothetical protein [Candidatus Acetothermia bacterium]
MARDRPRTGPLPRRGAIPPHSAGSGGAGGPLAGLPRPQGEPVKRIQVLLCSGTACQSSGSERVKRALLAALASHDLLAEVQLVETGCMGPCERGPVLLVYPEGTFYVKVRPDDAAEIVTEHFLKGRPVRRLLWAEGTPQPREIPFFARQRKLVLRNCGTIDPEKIEEYIASGGYEG